MTAQDKRKGRASHFFNFRLSDADRERLQRLSQHLERDKSDVIRELLREKDAELQVKQAA